MRILGVVALAFGIASVHAAPPTARNRVDLDKPGVMDALQRDNPKHFRRVSGILDLATEMPCQTDEFAKASRARFDAEDAKCGVLLKTSDPAKRVLSFVVDDTSYVSVVRMKRSERLVPATQ